MRMGLTDTPGAVRGVVSYYGDLRPVIPLVKDASRRWSPPILIAKGAKDDVVPPGYIEGFVSAAQRKDLDITVLTHETGAHAFDLSQSERSRAIVKQTVETIVGWLHSKTERVRRASPNPDPSFDRVKRARQQTGPSAKGDQ